MSKKTFKGGLNSLLGAPERQPRGRPKTAIKTVSKSSEIGTKENETRATFILDIELLDKLEAIAYWERLLMKEVVSMALEEYVDKKKPKPRPKAEREKKQARNQKLIKIKGNKARLPKY